MKKILAAILITILCVFSVSCSGGNASQGVDNSEETQQAETENTEPETELTAGETEKESVMADLTLKINDEEVDVKWEDNESVRALAELAAAGPVTINTSRYGGFEQVGGLGTTLPSNDVNTTTEPGDIVLYSSSNIVVFFGSNSWAYTRLGHIEGKSDGELRDLLGGNNAVLTFVVE